MYDGFKSNVNSLWSDDTTWKHRSGWTLGIILGMGSANETLQYVISHWLRPYPEWSLNITCTKIDPVYQYIYAPLGVNELNRSIKQLQMSNDFTHELLQLSSLSQFIKSNSYLENLENYILPNSVRCNYFNLVPLRDMTVNFKGQFSNSLHKIVAWALSMELLSGEVSIGSGNDLVPWDNKPLPEPMLTQI